MNTNISRRGTIIITIVGVLVIGLGIGANLWRGNNTTQNLMENSQPVSIKLGESVTVGSDTVTFERVEPATVQPGPAEVFLEPQYVFSLAAAGSKTEFKLSTITATRVVGGVSVSLSDAAAIVEKEKDGIPANEVLITVKRN
ncbi:MAG TPA: hypothetical protein VK145_01845 [Candidatus Nanoarchaeia archaeon]|nr:hypothetical protein [Candidatus Nanoarchaeia archaeon]